MQIANTQIAKIAAVAAVAGLVASSFAVFAPAVRAQMTTTTTTTSSMMFTRDLTLGSSGADVTALQNWLISKGFSVPAGATGYFGAQTQAALAAYQAANGISPAAGYFGPITRAKVNMGAGTGTGTGSGSDDDDDDDDDNDDDDNELDGGETSIEEFDVNDADDNDIQEGDSEVEVAEIEFEVEDADARLDRADFVFNAANSNEEDKPWKVFDTVFLMNGDDVIAEMSSDDEDDWDETDTDDVYRIRMTDIDEIFNEGDDAELSLAVDVTSSVDGADTGEDWAVSVESELGEGDGFRFVDGEDIDTEEGSTETANFTIGEEGEDNEYSLTSSDEDPEGTTIEVDDNGESDDAKIFVFTFEADEDSDEDLEVEDFSIDITVGNPSGGDASVTQDDVISDVFVVINGQEFDADAAAGDTDDAIGNGATDTASYAVDLDDEDFIAEAGEEMDIEVRVEFNALDGDPNSYDELTTIFAAVDSTDFDVVGVDSDEDVADPSDTVTGETHSLTVAGISVDFNEEDSDTDTGNNFAEYRFELDIEAFGDDVDLTAADFDFTLSRNGTTSGLSVNPSESLESDDFEDNGGTTVEVEDGEEGRVIYTVTIFADAAGDNGSYTVTLDTVNGTEVDESLTETLTYTS